MLLAHSISAQASALRPSRTTVAASVRAVERPDRGQVVALVGSGAFIAQATASSYIGVVTREDRGLAVGLYSSAYYLGGTLGGSLPSVFWQSGGWVACKIR